MLARPQSDARTVIAVGLFGLSVALVTTLARGGLPVPHVHDEFSYLLASDTFARGRLSNATHPMWMFFETFHVLQQPTYASKYPPAQGLFLAVGQVITGRPIVGVWLSYSLMCAAFTWMLLAWTRRRWAFAGGVVAALFLVGFHADKGSWASSYWGGAVAALGGALLFGGLRRVVLRPTVGASILMATGVGILANSRPFEGLLVALPALVVLTRWVLRSPAGTLAQRLRTGVLPAALVLAGFGAAMAHYNASVTGSAWRLPYQVYERTYGTTSSFSFGARNEVTYRHAEMEEFYRTQRRTPRSAVEAARRLSGIAATYQAFYVPVFVSVLVFLFPSAWRSPSLRLPMIAIAVVAVGLASETWYFGHYAAPAAAPLLLLYVASARRLRLLRIGRAPVGRRILRFVVACTVLSAIAYPAFRLVARDRYAAKWFEQRAALARRLERTGGRHLVVVTYGPSHAVSQEWVYNGADIDGAPVVWARSMGARDSLLLQHFRDRAVWTLAVNLETGPFELVPARGAMTGDSRRVSSRVSDARETPVIP